MVKKQKFEIPAMRGFQHGEPIYSIMITDVQRKQGLAIQQNNLNSKNNSGYQRGHDGTSEKRIAEIASYMSNPEHGTTTDAIILNYPLEQGDLAELFVPNRDNPQFGNLVFDKPPVLNNIDGGHRVAGYNRAIDLGLLNGNYDLPAILLNVTADKELLQFAIKNMTAEKPQSDHILDLQVQLKKFFEEATLQAMPKRLTNGINWKPEARNIAMTLNTKDSGDLEGNPWKGRLKLANSGGPRKATGQYWFKLGKFAEYNRPLAINSDGLFPEEIKDRSVVLCNFWKALVKIMPACFGPKANEEYKLVCAHVAQEPLGRILPHATIWCFYDGKVPKFENWAECVESLKGQVKIPTVDQFVDALRCFTNPFDNSNSPEKCMKESYWTTNGGCRHHHGKGNVSVVVRHWADDLDIPPVRNDYLF